MFRFCPCFFFQKTSGQPISKNICYKDPRDDEDLKQKPYIPTSKLQNKM